MIKLFNKNIFSLLLLLTISFVITVSCSNNSEYYIKGEIKGLNNISVFLASYYGTQITTLDSTIIKNGKFKFIMPSNSLPGMYRLYLTNKELGFDFIFNYENFRFETKKDSLISAIKILESEENKMLYSFLPIKVSIENLLNLGDRLNKQDPISNKPKLIEINNIIDSIEIETHKILYNTDSLDKQKLAYHVLKASFYPNYYFHLYKGGKEYTNSFDFMQKHFFDNLNFNETKLLRTPLIYNLIEDYLSFYVNPKTTENYIKASNFILSKSSVNDTMFNYVFEMLLNTFETSEFVEVYIYLMETYFTEQCEDNNPAYADKQNLFNLVKKSMPGNIVNNFYAFSKDGDSTNLYNYKSDVFLLFFWAPDCPFCKQQIEFLKHIKNKYQNKDIKIIAFGITESKSEWLKSIDNYQINNWTNISDFKGTNSSIFEKIHIRGTPELYLLSEDFKILSRPKSGKDLENKLIQHFNKR